MKDQIAELLIQTSQLIDLDEFSHASDRIRNIAMQHPEWMDDRLQAELQLVMKAMEYKVALKDFAYLRALAIVYKYCEMNYADALRGIDTCSGGVGSYRELSDQDVIWWCWMQGLENAPAIVKCCYRSLEKLGKRIVVLDQTNLTEYVRLPDFVEKKYRAGIIGRAHYADLVRLELLTQRGGTWIDATTYLTGAERILPLMEEPLFLFRSGNVSEYIIFDNWFMHAGKMSGILEATKKMLYAYWEQENEAKHYFIFQLMMTLACKEFPTEYREIPVFSNEPCHVLQYEMGRPYSEKRWKQITGMSDIHKLTYKLDEVETENSFLEYLLQRDAD